MDTADIEVFLTLAEELHFRRTAERLRVTQPRVSRVVAALERQTGGKLFERTSREVRLTPVGALLRDRLQPAYTQLQAAFDEARLAARGTAGELRIGFTLTTQGPVLTRLAAEFEAGHRGCRTALCEVDIHDPYGALRRGEIDVLVNWLAVDESDLTSGPAIEYRQRMLAVGISHPLAERRTVHAEELADYETAGVLASLPAALQDAIMPARTPSGRPILRTHVGSAHDLVTQIVSCRAVHPTMAGILLLRRDDIAMIPIEDLPPLPLGLIWRTSHENARIRALAASATSITGRLHARRGENTR